MTLYASIRTLRVNKYRKNLAKKLHFATATINLFKFAPRIHVSYISKRRADAYSQHLAADDIARKLKPLSCRGVAVRLDAIIFTHASTPRLSERNERRERYARRVGTPLR